MDKDLSSITKLCTVCRKTKKATEFTLNARSSDGLEHKCKDCRKKRGSSDQPVSRINDENNEENNMVFASQEGDQPVITGDQTVTHALTDDLDIETAINSAHDERITISIDFSDYPELYQALSLHAFSEMRTPEMQAAYMLRERLRDIGPDIERYWGIIK